jgi:8-hydroxy-5-deazaflavin:NADPH oxidoreductase
MMDSDLTSTRVAVIGAGNVGSRLARGLTRAGHRVSVGARDPRRAVDLASEGIVVTDPATAADGSEVIVLAVPVPALVDAVGSLGPLRGKILVDATNAVGTPIPNGHDSVGAHVAELAPDAFVVKAFNTIGAEHLEDGAVGGVPAFLPIAGADEGRPTVAALARSIGFEVADLGGPEHIGMVEDAARLWIHLAFRQGWGRAFGFGVLRA